MSKKASHLGAMEGAILIQHSCKPTHRETVFVHEKTAGQETVWKGRVEIFDLQGHKEAKTCYAWHHTNDDGKVKIFAVLGNNLIDSPQRAVQAAIFMDIQPASLSQSVNGKA